MAALQHRGAHAVACHRLEVCRSLVAQSSQHREYVRLLAALCDMIARLLSLCCVLEACRCWKLCVALCAESCASPLCLRLLTALWQRTRHHPVTRWRCTALVSALVEGAGHEPVPTLRILTPAYTVQVHLERPEHRCTAWLPGHNCNPDSKHCPCVGCRGRPIRNGYWT